VRGEVWMMSEPLVLGRTAAARLRETLAGEKG
jgi:hypothetical protein